jgi:ribosomal protein S18 acetylase RimI-like enzyme
MLEEVVISDYRDCHATGLDQLDTSFDTDCMFTVTVEDNKLLLVSVPLTAPRQKSYSIAADSSWTHGFVAVQGEQLLGFVATRYEEWNRRLVICHFYVARDRRGQGIGRRLMEHAIEQGQGGGAATAWAETSNLNFPGVQAYRRLGFSLCGFDASLYIGTPAEDEVAVFLSRRLGDPTGKRHHGRPSPVGDLPS